MVRPSVIRFTLRAPGFVPVLTFKEQPVVAERACGKGQIILLSLDVAGRLTTNPVLGNILRNRFDFYEESFLLHLGLLQPSFSLICNFVFSHIARYAPKTKLQLNKK